MHTNFKKIFHAILFFILMMVLTSAQPAYAGGSIVVDTNADNTADDGFCTLREAIEAANTNADVNGADDCDYTGSGDPDSITFAATYIITLSSELPKVTSEITITGNGNTIVQANAAQNTANYRVIAVDTTGNLTIEGLTLRHGKCSTVNPCSSTGSIYAGAAVSSTGTLTILNSTIANNNGYVGAVSSNGTLTIKNSTFASNDGNFGAAVYTGSSAAFTTIVNSTFFDNDAVSQGGAIMNSGTMTLVNNTISANSSPLGAGLYTSASGTLHMTNNILANGITGTDCYNDGGDTIDTNVNNLIETNGPSGKMCGTPAFSADPALDTALASNGGSTQTLALFSQSPAIDAGDITACADAGTVNNLDQRGTARPAGSSCDLGAFEAVAQNGTALIVNTNDDINDGSCDFFVSGSKDCSLREAIIAANTQAGTQSITFDNDYTITLSSILPTITTPMSISDANAGVIIQASTCEPITVPGGCSPAAYGIFDVNGIVNTTFDGLTLRYATNAITNNGSTMSIANVTITNNKTTAAPAVTMYAGQATITNSALINNYANGDGGAIYMQGSSSLVMVNSTVSGNRANFDGGILNSGTGSITIYNSTITNNSTRVSSSGIFGGDGNLTLYNTIVAGNTTEVGYTTTPQCKITAGTLTADSHNIDNDDSCGNATVLADLADLHLGALQNNGGSTQTHALLSGSTAIDAGDDAVCAAAPVNNQSQNGITRPVGSHCDVGSFESDTVNPAVSSITRTSTNPTSAASVNYTVTFSEAVQNVDVNDFIITKSSGISGASVSAVSGSGATYTVTVNTGTGSGTLRLDIPVSASIQDLNSNALSSLPFTSGEVYTKTISSTFKSTAANDGWILESSETSNTGGTLNSTQTTFILGDDAADKQYRAILHFDTSALPDTAVVTNMTLKIKQQGSVTGTSPFTFGSLYVDMRNPAFGTSALELTDFNFAAKKVKPAVFNPNPVSGWFSARFNNGGNLYINRTGVSQLRLYFSVDDNNNNIADFIRFFSGNAAAGDRPKLLITYYVP